jgi:hypothetical protein
MIRSQIKVLTETGNELLLKARSSASLKEVEAFTRLGMSCLNEAREIAESMKRNSILLYLECVTQAVEAPNYKDYLDFCARNSLDTLAQADFFTVIGDVLLQLKKGDR